MPHLMRRDLRTNDVLAVQCHCPGCPRSASPSLRAPRALRGASLLAALTPAATMPRRGLLLLFLLASACNGDAKKTGEKERHARKAAARRARHRGERASDLVKATGGMCHFLESEAFTGACGVRLARLTPRWVRVGSLGSEPVAFLCVETFTALNTTRWETSSMAGACCVSRVPGPVSRLGRRQAAQWRLVPKPS
jgi:hypothetical protein